MSKLILIRHGESFANSLDLFSGWLDVGLTAKGIKEAQKTGKHLADFKFHEVYTSNLSRAYLTAMIILSENKNVQFPIFDHPGNKKYTFMDNATKDISITIRKDNRLNERFYGSLQGRSVKESKKFIVEKNKSLWETSFSNIKSAEPIRGLLKRTKLFYDLVLIPKLSKEKNLLIVSHGTCIGALLTHIQNIKISDIKTKELPNSKPIIFSYTKETFELIKNKSLL
jgi:2,3-bisphosphoglycerate-dependent phosphoglycerate mutase